MPSKGYVLNGVYHRVEQVPMAKLVRTQQGMFKQGDHARQRFDHGAEILQPYDHTGKPNKKFIEANPEAAAEYGFVPKSGLDTPLMSDTPLPGTKQNHFGGSRPWGS